MGSEPTPAAFVQSLVRVFGLVREAMADHATLWCNIGDSYASGGGQNRSNHNKGNWTGERDRSRDCVEQGNLCLIPQRLAIALQDDGWIVRSQVIWCLSPSTRVYARTATTEGPATLHDLIRLDPQTVKLWTGQQWTRVRGWSKTRCDRPLRLTLRSGETIGTTPNHQWPLADGRLVRADELRVGDVLASCELPEADSNIGGGIDPDLAWFAGLYLAEGCVSGDGMALSGNANETERHDRVCRLALRFGGSSTLRGDEGDSVTQTVHSAILRGAVEHFVAEGGARQKHLRPRCWMLPNRLLRAFLDGYLAGDGHWDEPANRWRLNFTRNDSLAADLRTLSARLGLTLTLKPTYATNGPKRFESYNGELRFVRSGHHNEKSRSEVVEIEGGVAGDYIDVGVENESHLFALASGVLTHNSKPSAMPASLSGWMWRKCRVKVKGQPVHTPGTSHGSAGVDGNGRRDRVDERLLAQWADCPGCRKCEKNGGLVLRRGSWRPTSSYEPVLMLAKSDRYYCDGIAVQTPAAQATVSRDRYTRVLDDPDEQYAVAHDHETDCGGAANLRDVWRAKLSELTREELEDLVLSVDDGSLQDVLRIAAEPLKAAHYAAFPTALVSNCLRAGTSSRGYCRACGAPWCRVVDREQYQPEVVEPGIRDVDESRGDKTRKLNGKSEEWKRASQTRTLDWRPSCSCDAGEPRPGKVLDCFAGTSRTGVGAQRLGLDFVGVELSEEYCALSRKILYEEMPLFHSEDAPAAGREGTP